MGNGSDEILSSLVGEGRKFKTVQDLAKGKVEADGFIEKLKEENNALRSVIRNSEESRRSYEVTQDLLNRVLHSSLGKSTTGNGNMGEGDNPSSHQNAATGDGTNHQTQAATTTMTSRDVEMVYRQMRQREREDANEALAMQKLSDVYADKTEEFLTKKSRELALDVSVLKAMARQSPVAFFNIVGETHLSSGNNRNSGGGAPRGSVNSAAITDLSGDAGLRDKKYYDKIRKEMGAKAFILDRRLQVQMHKDMQSLGDRWSETA